MSNGLLVLHADAVLQLLRGPTDLTVFPPADGGSKTVPPGARPPYVVAQMSGRRVPGPDLVGRSTRFVLRIYLQHVALSERQARALSDLTAGLLLDVRLQIPGRNCWRITHASDQPPRTDETAAELIVTLTEVYRLESVVGPTT